MSIKLLKLESYMNRGILEGLIFSINNFFYKIPLNPPFPKGEVKALLSLQKLVPNSCISIAPQNTNQGLNINNDLGESKNR